MKKTACLLCLIALGIMSAAAQPLSPFSGTPGVPSRPPGLGGYSQSQDEPKLTTFNLDFPGGTPADLVKSIEKATSKPLNAIIPTEGADIQLPPLKMNDVTTPKLFASLSAASEHYVAVSGGYGFPNSYQQVETGYGFKTSDNPITDASIWSFYVNKPNLPPVITTSPICRFYQLQRYLNRGFTVDDITTAIQTGWKMAGISPVPELNYHKQTNLLIAFGKPDDLATIQAVLDALPPSEFSITDMEHVQKNVASLQEEVDKLDKKISSKPNNIKF